MTEKEKVRFKTTNDLFILLDKEFRNVFNPEKFGKENYNVSKNAARTIANIMHFEGKKCKFNQFDKLVFCAAVSDQLAGNKNFTIRRLWRLMGGGHTLTAAMREAISESIEKLACTRVTIDASAENEKYKYSDKEKVIFKNYLLPCKSIEYELNGEIIDGFYEFTDKSPVFLVAELEKQFTKQPLSLLNVPKLRNSALVMKLKFCLLERITAIVGSQQKHKAHVVGKDSSGKLIFKRAKKLHKIITFDSIFEQCELKDAEEWKKQDARNVMKKILDHFKEKNLITEWTFEKKDGEYYSIHFE